ncbi:MAG: fused MFS/spermidine synthase, partial [Nitrospinaceae bacterium]
LHLLEFAGAALLMFPATLLMGATLPVVGCWGIANRPDRILGKVSRFYSLNTWGAVAGCLSTQFWAVAALGVAGTTWAAAAVNGLVCLLCWIWRPGHDRPAPEPASAQTADPANQEKEAAASRPLARMLLLLFGLSGFTALACEILWTRVLVFPLGGSLYSFALILAAFLAGIAAGSQAARFLFAGRPPARTFVLLEAGIGILGLLMIPALSQVTELTAWFDSLFYEAGNSPLRTLAWRSAMAFGLMCLPTFGFGLAFPLANQIHFRLFQSVPATLGNSYAVNTLGAILGTVLTPFLLIPHFGIERSLFLVFSGLILMSGAAWTLFPSPRTGSGWRAGPAAAVGAVLGAYLLLQPGVATDRVGERNFSRIDFNVPPDRLKLLAYLEGNFSTLSVIEDREKGARTLFVDGFSTATVSGGLGGAAYMQAMGFVPMMLHPAPAEALVIGFGTGSTLGAAASFPGAQVDLVEIDRNVLTLGPWFSRWNGDVLKKPNVRVHIQDGRHFLRWQDRSFDVITLEPMHPAHAGVAHLYSQEFYEEAARRLKPGGILMQWLPLHLLSQNDAMAVLETFRRAFPHTSVWNSFLTRIVLLVGSAAPVTLDPALFRERLRHAEVAKSAHAMGIYSFVDFMDLYLADTASLTGLLQGVPLITDDRPLLEHSSVTLVPPFARETDETFLNLLVRRVGAMPPFKTPAEGQRRALREAFDRRTAQRLSIFSQRYHGPGAQAFAAKRYRQGLQEVAAFLRRNPGDWIRVADGGWKREPAED